MTYDVFMSYARKDGVLLVQKIAEKLRETGLQVFLDQDSIPAGSNWEQKLDEALDESAHILVILTPASIISEEVTAEWRPMLSRGKNIIPLMYVTCEIPRRLSMRQYIDFRDESRFTLNFTELIAAINTFKPESVQLELSGADLLQRAQTYRKTNQLELAIDDYLSALKDIDVRIRTQAADSIRELGIRRAMPAVVRAVPEETNAILKMKLLAIITQHIENKDDWRISVPDLVELLSPSLKSDNEEIRRQTIRIFAYGQAVETAPQMIHILKTDSSPLVRTQAALALGRLKTPNGIQALLGALQDPDEDTRIAAIHALGIHANINVISYLQAIVNKDRSAKVRNAANEVIADIKKRAK